MNYSVVLGTVLDLKEKDSIVSQIQESFETALSVVVASLHGIKSNSINKLRKEARKVGVGIKVAPNSLLCKAIMCIPQYKCLSGFFVGQIILAFSTKHPSDAARVFIEFSKDHECFEIKGASFEGKFISPDHISLLSNLPDYKGAILWLISLLKISTVGKLINILQLLSNGKVKIK